jgi:hypothetical protein
MESGSKQLDWIHVRSSPVLRELQGIKYLRMLGLSDALSTLLRFRVHAGKG